MDGITLFKKIKSEYLKEGGMKEVGYRDAPTSLKIKLSIINASEFRQLQMQNYLQQTTGCVCADC